MWTLLTATCVACREETNLWSQWDVVVETREIDGKLSVFHGTCWRLLNPPPTVAEEGEKGRADFAEQG